MYRNLGGGDELDGAGVGVAVGVDVSVGRPVGDDVAASVAGVGDAECVGVLVLGPVVARGDADGVCAAGCTGAVDRAVVVASGVRLVGELVGAGVSPGPALPGDCVVVRVIPPNAPTSSPTIAAIASASAHVRLPGEPILTKKLSRCCGAGTDGSRAV
jgi:hypothetical protein